MEGLKVLEVVSKSNIPKTVVTKLDDFTKKATEAFDYDFNGTSYFYPYNMPTKIPKEFGIGIIIGASGTGKSTLLKEFGEEEIVVWENDMGIISHFDTPNEAVNKLSAVGLNSIPSWAKPYSVLSNGEKFRADLARKIKNNAVIDEFTSVVDRTVAKATSTSISKYIKKNDIKNIVFSSCHSDIIEWLEPDWIFNANDGTLYDGRSLRRPKIDIEIFRVNKDIWGMFKSHHYLSEDLNVASRCYCALWEGNVVGFVSALVMPSGTIKNSWREHRTVILPDYQGMGIGVALSDAIAEMYVKDGLKYYSRSAHPRFGKHRNESNSRKATTNNEKKRENVNEQVGSHKINRSDWFFDDKRTCFSHEYVGEDYFIKKHFKVLFEFSDDIKDYDNFEKKLLKLLQNKMKDNYVVFVSGRPAVEDTFAERFARKFSIRQENFPSDKKITANISKVCDAVISDNENSPYLKLAKDKNMLNKVI